MNKTLRALVIAVALAGAGTLALAQRPPVIVIEDSVETTTDQVLLPSSLAGKVSLRGGASLQLGPDSRFYAAGKPVSLKELAAFMRGVGNVPMTIHYRLKDGIVSRIVVVGQ